MPEYAVHETKSLKIT